LDQYPAEALRLLFVQSHYRSPLNFSKELIESSQKGTEKLNKFSKLVLSGMENKDGNEIDFDFSKYYNLFSEAMDDDFNTSQATAVIFDFTKDINKIIAQNTPHISKIFFKEAFKFLESTANDVLGIIDNNELKNSENIEDSEENSWIIEQIDARTKAKSEKNWKLADEIRNKLTEKGIILEDGKNGTTYKKK